MTATEQRGAPDDGGQHTDSHGDARRLIELFEELVPTLGAALPPETEVVLHDLAKLPNSIVAIHGTITGRGLGDPATDLLLERSYTGQLDHMIGYRTELPDGTRLRCSTIIIRDRARTPVAALCFNTSLDGWERVHSIATSILGVEPPSQSAHQNSDIAFYNYPRDSSTASQNETFVRDIDELAQAMIRRAISDTGVPVELMQKHHKIAVVKILKKSGVFTLKNAAETVASKLGVTRFTVYNYLNELDQDAT